LTSIKESIVYRNQTTPSSVGGGNQLSFLHGLKSDHYTVSIDIPYFGCAVEPNLA
jgi:hypothetical protein